MGQFFKWAVKEGRVEYEWQEAAVRQEQLLDGCFISFFLLPSEYVTSL